MQNKTDPLSGLKFNIGTNIWHIPIQKSKFIKN